MWGARSIAFVCAVLATTPAWATQVVPSGGVAISHGEGFRQITGTTEVAVGDSVVASPSGSAKIVYDDGCTVEVKPGDIATVQATSPCGTGAYAEPPRFFARPYLIGAAIVGGVITVVVLTNQDNNGPNNEKKKKKKKKPASP